MEENTIVTLLDENGKEVQFDLVMTFDYEGKRYAALLPMDDVDGVADDEVVLLEILREGGDETYQAIENPVLLDEVFNEFIELFDETFDDEEDE